MRPAAPLASYRNGGYEVAIFPDGTKIRRTVDPNVPPLAPEQMDLKLTDRCKAGCAWCHERSTPRGLHGDVDAILRLLSDLPPGVEIAIGGGDPLSHPAFERLAYGLRDFGLIPSVTVNGRHFDGHRPRLERMIADKAIFGVGVSFFETAPDVDWDNVVLHMIAGVDRPADLDGERRRKLLILGFKDHGRGAAFRARRPAAVDENIAQWRAELAWLAIEHHLSFDTLAIEQLEPRRLFKRDEDYQRRFMGAEGQFSLYVDGVTQTFATSSYSPLRAPWTDIRSMFATVRAGMPLAA